MIRVYIDLYNLLPKSPNLLLSDAIQSVIRACRFLEQKPRTRIHVRLYGGWYLGENLTKTGQLISAEASHRYPAVVNITDDYGAIHRSTVTCELAVSLEAQPRRIFHNTYSEKSPDWRIKSRSSDDFDCASENCSLNQIRKTLRKQKCTVTECTKPLKDILYRSEQKMVDSMVSCDLIKKSGNFEDTIVVVSDDSDFFPSISCLVEEGVRVAWMVKNNQHSCASLLTSFPNFHLITF